FAQYDNTGRILDFLVKNFDITVQFSFDHLRLKNGRKTNFIKIYENGKLVEEKKLLSLRTPPFLLFSSLPFVAFLMFIQTFFYSHKVTKKYGKFDIFFTVNAFSGCIGLLLKKFLLVKKTVFWVWDYFPLSYPDWRMKLARWVYWQFDKPCMQYSDRIIFTNKKLSTLRKKAGIIKSKSKPTIVPLGTNVQKVIIRERKKIVIGFLGMLKASQGIDALIDNLPHVIKHIPHARFEIIGSGPEEQRLKEKAKKYGKYIIFHGFIENQNKIEKITKNWTIGTALYTPDESNESYWGDPSKIKIYISLGIPVITTNVSHFSDEITKAKAGKVVPHGSPEHFVQAMKHIIRYHTAYQRDALKLAKKYHYEKIYPEIFNV
ncbi:MAG TPA: glycosyltransferase, partial [Patescibacteria group bacterium]|nr:glycosyltransferase [Patescibacteria group bacterium]